jgi:hypothetical protein
MFSSRRTLLEIHIVWFTAGVLIIGLALAIPVAAQKPEQRSSVPCDRTEAVYQQILQSNRRVHLTTTASPICFLTSAIIRPA